MEGYEYERVEDWVRRAPFSPTYYEVLGVHIDAGRDVIHTAWKLMARKYHPDLYIHVGGDAERHARERMVLINEAWSILKDPVSRRRYDLFIGARSASCSRCGALGKLRAAAGGAAVGLFDDCYSRR